MVCRAHLFGIRIDALDMRGAVDRVFALSAERDPPCRYVVTPNVDHTLLLQRNSDFLAAYEDASLVLVDGAPVVLASRMLGCPLPERVAGSDLVMELFGAVPAHQTLTVFLLGAAPGVADRAARRIEERYSGVEIVGTRSPPFGFENDDAETSSILAEISEKAPDVVVLGLGSPKQELWVHRHRHRLRAGVALCVGAAIDFLAGQKPRAPVWMRQAGLEWLYRAMTEPKRLGGRYAKNALGFPRLVWREWRTGSKQGPPIMKS